MTDVPLRCRCGLVRGTVTGVHPRLGTRTVCYCDDCQAFARFLGSEGIMNASGGTDVAQLPASRMTITAGEDQLRCVRLSAKGMFRWYTGCCKTAIGNTLGAGVPFIGLIHTFIDPAVDEAARESTFGKPVGVQARFAVGPTDGAHPTAPPSFMLRVVSKLAWWWLTGRGKPSPVFDSAGAPRVTPEILTPEQRAQLGPP